MTTPKPVKLKPRPFGLPGWHVSYLGPDGYYVYFGTYTGTTVALCSHIRDALLARALHTAKP